MKPLSCFVCLWVPIVACSPLPPAPPAPPPPPPTEAPAPEPAALPAAPAGMPFLHPLFSENAVLEQGRPVSIWGWTQPGAKVSVALGAARAEATAGADGKWLAELGPLAAGGPHTLLVDGPAHAEVANVRVGEVWLCSGQSNMEWSVAQSNDAEREIAASQNPNLFLLTSPHNIQFEPQTLNQVAWQPATPESVANFSAVCYFFGRKLQAELGVPVGLVQAAWGGTPIRAWMSGAALGALPETAAQVAALKTTLEDMKKGVRYEDIVSRWWTENDPGTQSGAFRPDFDDFSWKTLALPVNWESSALPDYDGIVWFRRPFKLTKQQAAGAATLSLGPIDDRDTTFVNGEPVGSNERWDTPRKYEIRAGLLREGVNTIAVRVLDTGGGGGIYGKPEDMLLAVPGATPISLAGEWRYSTTAPLSKVASPPQRPENNPNEAGVLYNGMLAPLVPYGIAGALWYQGESDAWQPELYRRMLKTMIGDWRQQFAHDFPFFVVQLASFQAIQKAPSEGGWALLREAQFLTARDVPNTGLCVTTDIGDAKDIHPRNKQEVGARAAAWALATQYKKPGAYSGPVYKSTQSEGKSLRITFDAAGQALSTSDKKPLRGFAIAGADGKFVWATAKIEGSDVVVSSPRVPAPTVVHYNWANNPIGNLVNQAGLPATSFRSDAPN